MRHLAKKLAHGSAVVANQVKRLFENANLRHDIGEAARIAVDKHQGNIDKVLQLIRPYLS